MSHRSLSLLSACSIGLGAILGSTYERYRIDPDFGLRRHIQSLLTVNAASTFSASGNIDTSSKNLPVQVSPKTGDVVKISSEIVRLGLPGMDNLQTFDDYIISYDRRHRNSHWVFEHLTRDKVRYGDGVDRGKCEFQTDSNIHPFFAATNDDFKNSGYDRGHMAAAANHRWSQTAMHQTFILSNISPQVGKGFNRDIWCQLEKFVRRLTKKYKNVYVCTGPLYLPKREDDRLVVRYEVIGRNNVAVPTHFFKVIIMETDTREFEMLSFVLPNQVISEQCKLRQYLVPIEAIERSSGLLMFDKIPRKNLRKINDSMLLEGF